ncbi:partial Rhamnolipids biosynthesis 3-oxoacyl-[acyl-carrier-protein] reductase, partial [Gammaproteobacteria bacterium]
MESGALDMSGRVVVVTGGTRGVGRGIALRMLEAGAEVLVCGRSEPAELPMAGGRTALFVAADVRVPEQIDPVIDA